MNATRTPRHIRVFALRNLRRTIRLGMKSIWLHGLRSLLTVLLPARELRQSLVPNLQSAVRQLLIALGISPETVSREIAEMQPVAFTSAVNRRVLGSMNDFAWQLGFYLSRTDDALELARRLSETPMSAVGSKSRLGIPADVARELLAAHYSASPFRH